MTEQLVVGGEIIENVPRLFRRGGEGWYALDDLFVVNEDMRRGAFLVPAVFVIADISGGSRTGVAGVVGDDETGSWGHGQAGAAFGWFSEIPWGDYVFLLKVAHGLPHCRLIVGHVGGDLGFCHLGRAWGGYFCLGRLLARLDPFGDQVGTSAYAE